MLETLLSLPGFIYQADGRFYYLGKWICKECTDTDASDCAVMYRICSQEGEEQNASFYFQKIRAYSDFALDIPYNPQKIREDMETLLDGLPEAALEDLKQQAEQVQSASV